MPSPPSESGDSARSASAMASPFASPALIQLDQSCSSPLHRGPERSVFLSPSQTSVSVNTYGGRRALTRPLSRYQPLRTGSHTENEPAACAYSRRPELRGRSPPDGTHRSDPGMRIPLYSGLPRAVPSSTQTQIDAGSFTLRGRASKPNVIRRLTSAGQLLVTAHHALSRRKLFPRPLSPVIRFTRGANFACIRGAGPTLRSTRSLSMIIAASRGTRLPRHPATLHPDRTSASAKKTAAALRVCGYCAASAPRGASGVSLEQVDA